MLREYSLAGGRYAFKKDQGRSDYFKAAVFTDSVALCVQRILKGPEPEEFMLYDEMNLSQAVFSAAYPDRFFMSIDGVVKSIEEWSSERGHLFPVRYRNFQAIYLMYEEPHPQVRVDEPIVCVSMEVKGPTYEHVCVTGGQGGVFVCKHNGVNYYNSARSMGDLVSVPDEVRKAFFYSEVLLSPESTDYTNPEMYKTHAFGYGAWCYASHKPKVEVALSYADDTICVPGDNIGIVTWRAAERHFKIWAGDLHVNAMTHPLVRSEGLSATMRRALDGGCSTLILGYLSAFMNDDDWKLARKFRKVILYDIEEYVPPIPMNWSGSGIWTTEVFMTHLPPDRQYPSVIPFSMNLIQGAPYTIAKVSKISEYLRVMMPDLKWGIDGSSTFVGNMIKRGYSPSSERPYRLVSGMKELRDSMVDEVIYFAKIGRAMKPIALKPGERSLRCRTLYWVDRTSELFDHFVRGGNNVAYFYANDPGKVLISRREGITSVKVTLVFTVYEDKPEADNIGMTPGGTYRVVVNQRVSLESRIESAFDRFYDERGVVPKAFQLGYEAYVKKVRLKRSLREQRKKAEDRVRTDYLEDVRAPIADWHGRLTD